MASVSFKGQLLATYGLQMSSARWRIYSRQNYQLFGWLECSVTCWVQKLETKIESNAQHFCPAQHNGFRWLQRAGTRGSS
jgi:hypothetical protein